MRRLVCLLPLLLSACIEYKIVVTTVVQADGTLKRKITFQALKEPGKTWQRLAMPEQPYTDRKGDEEKGFEVAAELKAGSYPSGLRVILGGKWGEKEATPPGLPVAEGTVDVRALDLIIGTLYRYEERVALGTDPVKFREELPKWLDLALRFLLEALKEKFPDIDFAPVEARARSELLPQVEKAIVNLHHAGTSILLELEPLSAATSPATLSRSEFWPAVVREFAAFGVDLPKDPAGLQALTKEKEGEKLLLGLGERLIDKALAPLPEARRAEVKTAILSGGLEKGMDAVAKRLYPTKEAEEKLQGEIFAFASKALGAYVVYGLFDSFDLRFRVEMPGKLLRTNGDLGTRGPSWHLDKPVLVPPALFAYSFLPKEGVPGEEWSLAKLGEIASVLEKMTPETRAQVARVVKAALADGNADPKEEGEGLGEEHTDESHKVLRLIREALEEAK